MRFPNFRHSLVRREPAFAHDLLLLACVLVACVTRSAQMAFIVYGGLLAIYLWRNVLARHRGGASAALDVARSLRLAATAGLGADAVAPLLAPLIRPLPGNRPFQDAVSAATPYGALLEPVLARGSLESSAEYLDEVAAYLERHCTNRDSLGAIAISGWLSAMLAPAIVTGVLVWELTALSGVTRALADPRMAAAFLAAVIAWLSGLLLQSALLEAFHNGTAATWRAISSSVAVCRAMLPGEAPAPEPVRPPGIRAMLAWSRPSEGQPPKLDRDSVGRVARVLTERAASIDRALCKALLQLYQLALFLTRGPALALAILLPLFAIVHVLDGIPGGVR